MTVELETALDKWCRSSLSIPLLEQMHVQLAFAARETLRRALAGELDLDDEDAPALDTADGLYAAAAARVIPLLRHGGWLDRRPPEHYAHWYVTQYGSGA